MSTLILATGLKYEKSPPNKLTYLDLQLHTYVITRQDKIPEIFVLLVAQQMFGMNMKTLISRSHSNEF